MKKTYRIILICMFMLLFVCSLCLEVNATALSEAKAFASGSHGGTTLSSPVQKVLGAVVNAVRVAAAGIAVIMLLAVAMKYMSAAPGEKAEIKKSAVIYVVGATVLFGASGILTIISSLAGNLGS